MSTLTHCRCGAALLAALFTCAPAPAQLRSLSRGPHRMEIMLERRDGSAWRTMDPGHVFEQNDRVRFRFRTNFDGYLYVMNQSTSGKYEQLFPRAETGEDNRVVASREYAVPSTDTLFRISGPAGHEIVYWVITPVELEGSQPRYQPLPPPPPRDRRRPPNLIPRCDDALLRARGDCIDTSAGAKSARPGALPENLAGMAEPTPRELLFMRQKDTSVVASPAPLTGPVIYEFRLAHK